MKDITLTCDNGRGEIKFTFPGDAIDWNDDPLYLHAFKTILYWVSFDPDTINQLIPDCEECQEEFRLNSEEKEV